MNFITNGIVDPVGGREMTFNGYVNKIIKEAAGEAKPECEDDGRGQDRGQVISDKGEAGE